MGLIRRRRRGADEQLTPASLAPAPTYRDASQRSEIDRWILSELNRTIEAVTAADGRAGQFQRLPGDHGLGRWAEQLVCPSQPRPVLGQRRCGRAIARTRKTPTGRSTRHSLQVTKLIAPFVPFLAETLWRHLSDPFADRVLKSVHLCDYPTPMPETHR